MRHRLPLVLLPVLLLSAASARAQGAAYAKFDSGGATIGLYNLLPDAAGCKEACVLTGRITKYEYAVNGAAHAYALTFSAGGRPIRLHFAFGDDEILPPDAADLVEGAVARKRRLHIRARQCGSAGVWTVEEIRRL